MGISDFNGIMPRNKTKIKGVKTMKKILVIALAVVMTFSIVAFAACAQPTTVTGEVHYTSHGHEYGAKVDVTVKGDVIVEVKLYTDEESGYVRTSADNETYGWTGFKRTEDAYAQYIADNFVGKTVAEVQAYVASATADGQTVTTGPKIEGSTQSSARIIVAVQNALSKLGK